MTQPNCLRVWAVCIMVSGVYEARVCARGLVGLTSPRCTANPPLADTLKPLFTSAAVSSVNSSVRPHGYAQPMKQHDCTVCVCVFAYTCVPFQ